MSIEKIVRTVLIEGLDDWVPVDRLIALAREFSQVSTGDFKEVVLEVCESVINRGIMTVGEIGEQGFEPWPGEVSQIVDKVARDLEGVDWMPFGGSCWLANTPLGDGLAETWAAGS